MSNDLIKQPADRPNNNQKCQEQGQQINKRDSIVKKRPSKKTIHWFVALVVIFLSLGGALYMLVNKKDSRQVQSTAPNQNENILTNVSNTGPEDFTVNTQKESDGVSTGDGAEQNELPAQMVDPNGSVKFFYILQPILCCGLIIINIAITIFLVSKFKPTKQENQTQQLLYHMRNNMGQWITKVNEIRIETNLLKNDEWNTVMFKLGKISEQLEGLANSITVDRNKILGGK